MLKIKIGFILLLLFYPSISSIALDNSKTIFYVYSNDKCQPCVVRYEEVRNYYSPIEFVKFDVSDKDNLNHFTDIVNILDPVLLSLPLFGVFSGSTLKIIVAGEVSLGEWNVTVKENDEGIPIYVGGENAIAELKTIVKDNQIKSKLTTLFRGGDIQGLTNDFWTLLIPVSIAAFMDAINPCAVSVFLVMLTLLLYSYKSNLVLKTGLAFSFAVFFTYLLFGLGLMRVINSVFQVRYLTAAFAFLFGVFSIYEFFTGAKKHIPDAFSNQISKYIEKVSNPRTGFFAGIITGSLLLPCSSAPYFIALNLLSEKATQIDGFILIVLYNFIIISPFLIITVFIYSFNVQTMDMRLWLQEKRQWINLLIGIGLILLSYYSIFG